MPYVETLPEALSPTFPDQYMLTAGTVLPDGRVWRDAEVITDNLGTLRGKVTSHSNRNYVNPKHSRKNFAFYKWDNEAEEWSLIDLIPMDTPVSEFPWKKNNKKG